MTVTATLQVLSVTLFVRLCGRLNLTGVPAAMQLGNWTHMGNIAGRDHTSTKWWVRLEQGRSHNRVLRNRVLHSREQSLKPKTEAESGSVSTVPTSITSSSAVVLGR